MRDARRICPAVIVFAASDAAAQGLAASGHDLPATETLAGLVLRIEAALETETAPA